MTRDPIRAERPPRLLVVSLLAFTAGLLLLSTVMTLLYVAAASRPAGSPSRDAAPAAVALARGFYAAVNQALAAGDTTPLTELVAPEFVEHPARTGAERGREALVQGLLALRAVSPGLRLVVDSATASADGAEVTVWLRTEGEASSFLGLGLPAELDTGGWGPVEVLRIAGGLVAERWGGHGEGVLLQPLAQTELPAADPSVPRLLALLRLTFAPSADLQVTNGLATRFLVIEAGALTVTIGGSTGGMASTPPVTTGLPAPDPPTVPENPPIHLTLGNALLTRPRSNLTIANEGDTPATLLMAVRYGVGWGVSPDGQATDEVWADAALLRAAGVTARLLALAVAPAGTGQTLAIGRAALAAGTRLTWPAGAATVLLAADEGQLALETASPGTHGIRADGQAWAGAGTTLAAGDGAALAAGTAATWRVVGDAPVTVLVLTLTSPAGEAARELAPPA